MNKKTIIVVGTQGARAACIAARQANEHARIIWVKTSHEWLSLKGLISFDSDALEQRLSCDDESCKERYRLEVITDKSVALIDVDAHCLIVESKGKSERLSYDSIVYAADAALEPLCRDDHAVSSFSGFSTLSDLKIIKKAIQNGAQKACVIGLGQMGIDAALALLNMGLTITAIDQKKRILPQFSWTFAAEILKQLEHQGVHLILGESLSAIEHRENNFLLCLSSQQLVEADLVINCTGVTPDVSLLIEAGAATDSYGLIRVDKNLQTTLPQIYACGLGITSPLVISNEPVFMAHQAALTRTAEIAGFNAATNNKTQQEKLEPLTRTVSIFVAHKTFARTGLLEHEARKYLGEENTIVVSEFAPQENRSISAIRLILDKKTKSIVGAEVQGVEDVLWVADLFAACVKARFGPIDLINMDFTQRGDDNFLKMAAMSAKQVLFEDIVIISPEEIALWVKNQKDFRLIAVDTMPKTLNSIVQKVLEVPLADLSFKASDLLKDCSPIVVCSRSASDRILAQHALTKPGQGTVYHLDGDILAFDGFLTKE